MGKRAILALMVWLLLIPVLWAVDHPQLLTIVPLSKNASSETKVPLDPQALVLVELRVAKGDTLWKFAKRYLARSQYYAQFLVYNDIKNPNRIYPGQILWVPLSPLKDHPEIFSGQPAPRWILLRSDLPAPAQPASGGQPGRSEKADPSSGEADRSAVEKALPDQPAVPLPNRESILSPQAAPPVRDLSVRQADPVQAEFEQDLNLFNRGECSTAAGRFESFLATYPDSPLRLRVEYYLAESYHLLEQEP